jgi:predicted methyltransferase
MKSAILAGAAALALTASFAHALPKVDIAAAVADPTRPDKDRALDESRKPAEILAAINLRRGQTVADIWPGAYWDRLFAAAVGPKGKVYAVHLTEADKAEHETTPAAGSAPYPEHPNITVVATTANTLTLPTKADVIWIRQNYHDLYDKFMGPSDVPAFNKAVFAALKPGGLFVVIDHSAPDGSGLASTDTTHRIDAARVKTDMAAAGFVFVKESDALRNPADPRTKLVFDPSIKGHTDQFIYIFRRP